MQSPLAPLMHWLPQMAPRHGRDKLLYQRLFWGALAGCLSTMLLAEAPVLNTMELNLLEWRFKVAQEIHARIWGTAISEEIVIVTYDDVDQFELEGDQLYGGPAPIQDVLARLIPRIAEANPLLIVVDINLAGKADPALVKVFNEIRSKIVLAIFGEFKDAAELPPPELRNAAAICAYDYLLKEENGLVCRLPVLPRNTSDTQEDGNTKPILTYGQEIFDSLPKAVAGLMAARSGVGPTIGQMPLFSRDQEPLYINFYGTRYKTFSTLSIMKNLVANEKLRGKTVIIGTNFTQQSNLQAKARTPLSRKAIHAHVQADAITTIHKNKIIRTFPQTLLHHLLLLASGALGAIASILRMGKRTTFFICTSMVIVAITQLLFVYYHLNVPIVPLLAVMLLSYIFGTVIYLDTDLRMSNKELQEARQAMQERAEKERQRIAEDLHDETLPALSSVARMADRLAGEIPEAETPVLMREKLDQAVIEMRRVINDLHPSVLETMGFKPALENLLVALEREMDIECLFIDNLNRETRERPALDNEPGSNTSNWRSLGKLPQRLQSPDKLYEDDCGLSEMERLQLYRMVQEGLNNVQKHSSASKVEISLEAMTNTLLIKVTDNGRGIEQSRIRADSHGLLNIRQRAQLIGARVEWSKPEKFETGTEMSISLLTL